MMKITTIVMTMMMMMMMVVVVVVMMVFLREMENKSRNVRLQRMS